MTEKSHESITYIVLCTCPNLDTASGLARKLVADRLAACCNLAPGVTSVYRWEGKVQEDPEVLLIAKTTGDRYAGLQRCIEKHHPYELPEILAVPVEAGLAGYMRWVAEETGSTD